jgi:hypothetical protein
VVRRVCSANTTSVRGLGPAGVLTGRAAICTDIPHLPVRVLVIQAGTAATGEQR